MDFGKHWNSEHIFYERIVLSVYFVYGMILGAVAWLAGWPEWILFLLAAGWVSSVVFHLAGYKSYRMRALFTTAMFMAGILVWALYAPDLFTVMPMLASAVVFLGLYGVPDIQFIPAAVSTFLFLYHGLVIRTVNLSSNLDILQLILLALSVYAVECTMYFLAKRRIEAGMHHQQVISELIEAQRSKDDFMANVSHEIRTPINTICGMSEIVLREQLEESVRADVFSIQAAGRNLLSVVSDVLDFSELQSGKLTLVEETYNITSTINDVINMTIARKNERQIELIVDCAADIPCGLAGDEQKLRRVIMNLVNNALKFTPEGYVSIAISCRRTDYGINLIVAVRDTGIGMAKESMERLFTTFNQVDTKRNRQEGGIGLGLAISRAIVDAMGGFITVDSRLGHGSEFRFVIPQKVEDPDPIVRVRNPELLNVAVYIDMEQFDRPEIRDEYSRMIQNMVKQFGVQNRICRNLAELKRRTEREIFSHIMIGIVEYEEGRSFFDEMSGRVKLVVILDRTDDCRLTNPQIQRLYKPLFILPIAMILNNEKIVQGMDENYYHRGKFIAPNAHILVVDDNLMNIRVLEGLVRPYQIKVSMATSGMEALEKIENMDYDFVFMDHMMPEMDGIETLHRIRQKQGSYFRQVPVIALTANAIGGMREVFLKEGFQDFVAKPVELSVLERVLRRHIPQNKQIEVTDFDFDVPGRGENVAGTAAPATHGEGGAAAPVLCGESGTAAPTAHGEGGAAAPVLCGESGTAVPAAHGEAGTAGAAAAAGDAGRRDAVYLPPDIFDMEMGIRYCGGRDNLLDVLRIYYEDGAVNQDNIQSYYNRRDWKNYAILVHALKSGMKSIGVRRLSDMAKELEDAGKRADEHFIWEHHEAMMREYGRVLNAVGQSGIIREETATEDVSGLTELEEAEFAGIAADFEEAAYSFDSDRMTGILERLMTCSYKGNALKKLLAPVERKVEMRDYLSAADTVMKIKERLSYEYNKEIT